MSYRQTLQLTMILDGRSKADLATLKSVHTYYWFPSQRVHPVHISLAGLADSQEALRESSQMPHTQEVGRLMKQVWT